MEIKSNHINKNILFNSKLEISITNFNYNPTFLNSLRRILLEYVPTYGFDRELIKISKNTGYQNNDQLSLRLSQIPVIGVNTDLLYIDDIRWNNIDYTHNEKEFPEEQLYEVVINVKNNNTEYKYITTNDFKIFINGTQIKNPYDQENPLLITILRQNEELICSMKAKIRLGILNTCWSPVYNTYYLNTSGNNYKFIIHSYGQHTEDKLFILSINILLDKLQKFNEYIKSLDIINKTKFKLKLNDKSIANILKEILQYDDNILFVGINIISFLDPVVDLNIEIKKNSDLKKIIDNNIKKIIKIYDELKSKFILTYKNN